MGSRRETPSATVPLKLCCINNCGNRDPEGSHRNVQGAGGPGVGLAELVCNGWAVRAPAVPVLNVRKGPGELKGSEGEIQKGETTNGVAEQWLLSLG